MHLMLKTLRLIIWICHVLNIMCCSRLLWPWPYEALECSTALSLPPGEVHECSYPLSVLTHAGRDDESN